MTQTGFGFMFKISFQQILLEVRDYFGFPQEVTKHLLGVRQVDHSELIVLEFGGVACHLMREFNTSLLLKTKKK